MSFLRRGGSGPDDLVRAAERIGVRDQRVLEALRRVPREAFVPPGSERGAYVDAPVPIPHGQTTSQPSLIAAMIETLELTGDERVLEIGTGYGFQTALLAELAAEVHSIERFGELADAARANLEEAGYDNVHVVVGDGNQGLPEHAPFDAMVLSAATPQVPEALIDQLAEGGRLCAPIGGGGAEEVLVYRRTSEGLERDRRLTHARFVPLRRGTVSDDR
jgi:protein-L-isoaspartate(D-aspartate) O-methyltransferase